MAAFKKAKNELSKVTNPQLALKCAQFFMGLGQSCIQMFQKLKRGPQKKTKIIKKTQKQLQLIAEKVSKMRANSKKKKSQNKFGPKKPLTAYILYFQQKKQSFVQKFPNLNIAEITKLIAKNWNELNHQQKQPYLLSAQKDRQRYESQISSYKNNSSKNGGLSNKQQQEQQQAEQIISQQENANSELLSVHNPYSQDDEPQEQCKMRSQLGQNQNLSQDQRQIGMPKTQNIQKQKIIDEQNKNLMNQN